MLIPVVFRANFRDPASYFAATHFKLSDKDVIYVSNAASYELYKCLALLNNSSSTIANVPINLASAKYGVQYLRGNVVQGTRPDLRRGLYERGASCRRSVEATVGAVDWRRRWP